MPKQGSKTPETHHRYSPSSLENYEGCPCFTRDDSRDTKAADEGTLLHKAAETGDLSTLEDQEHIDAVNSCLFFKQQVNEIIPGAKEFELFEELTVDIGPGLSRGTLDFLAIAGDDAVLADWKFGRIPVTPVIENIQIQAYVLGAFGLFPKLTRISAFVIQPRIDYRSHHTYLREDCDGITQRIEQIIARYEDPDKTPSTSEKVCSFCGNKGTCSALHTVAQKVSTGLDLPVVYEPGKLADPKDVSKALVLASILEDWAKQVRRVAKTLAVEDQVEFPGFGLRTRQGSVEVVDVYHAIQTLLDKHDAGLPSILQACSLSIPKLSESLAPFIEGTKKDVREILEEELESFTIRRDTVSFLQRHRGITNEKILQGHTS